VVQAIAPRSAGAAEILRRAGLDGRRHPETLNLPELARLSGLVRRTAEADSIKYDRAR
jgi:hypothetical protein